MATILVRYKKSGRFRFWNTVVDAWETPILTRDEAIETAIAEHNCSKRLAIEWVDRKKHTKEHLQWLDKFFDSQIAQLNRSNRKHAGNVRYCDECQRWESK